MSGQGRSRPGGSEEKWGPIPATYGKVIAHGPHLYFQSHLICLSCGLSRLEGHQAILSHMSDNSWSLVKNAPKKYACCRLRTLFQSFIIVLDISASPTHSIPKPITCRPRQQSRAQL